MPTGMRRLVWNVLMAISLAGAIAAAGKAIAGKASDPATGSVVITLAAALILAVLVSVLVRHFGGNKEHPADQM